MDLDSFVSATTSWVKTRNNPPSTKSTVNTKTPQSFLAVFCFIPAGHVLTLKACTYVQQSSFCCKQEGKTHWRVHLIPMTAFSELSLICFTVFRTAIRVRVGSRQEYWPCHRLSKSRKPEQKQGRSSPNTTLPIQLAAFHHLLYRSKSHVNLSLLKKAENSLFWNFKTVKSI